MPALPTGIDRLPSSRYRVRVTVDGQRVTRTLAEARMLRAELETATPRQRSMTDSNKPTAPNPGHIKRLRVPVRIESSDGEDLW